MTNRKKMMWTTIAVSVVLLALHPVAPLGATVWPSDPDAAEPAGWQLPLFVLLFLAEAGVSAFGVAYLVFGWRYTRGFVPEAPVHAALTHASIAFLFIQWWPHSNLHMSVPFSLGAILAIDYAFHVPIMWASLVIIAAVVRKAARARSPPEPMTQRRASGGTAPRAGTAETVVRTRPGA